MKQNNSNSTDMLELEDLQTMHQKVMDFTFNCDNKASFLGAVIGVLITAIVSASPFWSVVDKLCQSAKLYREGGDNVVFDWSAFFCGLFLVLSVIAVVVVLFAIFSVLIARLKSYSDSLIYFGTISRKTDEQYKTAITDYNESNLQDDYIHQIHICSQICAKKFKAYNVAVIGSIVSLSTFVIFVCIAVMIM